MTAAEVLEEWFDAHARADMHAARALLADDAPVTLPDGTTVYGFDDFMRWYKARRAAEGPDFSYEVVDLLGGEHHAAAVIVLRNAEGVRRQVAVYAISHGQISSVQLFEGGLG